MARSEAFTVPKVPEPFHDAVPFNTVNGAVEPEGTAANSGLGSIDIGPTASIAMNNLRRDNLTGGAFFICDYAKQFVTRLRLTEGADGRRAGTGKKILRQRKRLQPVASFTAGPNLGGFPHEAGQVPFPDLYARPRPLAATGLPLLTVF